MIRFFKVCLYLLMFSCFLICPAAGGEISGDINHDSTLDLRDAVLTLPILSGQSVNDQQVNPNGDVNSDGQIGLAETTFVLQSISGMRQDQPGSNAALSALAFCCGPLAPPFDPNIPAYYAQVENPVFEVTVTATAADPKAAITVGGMAADSGQVSSPVHVDVGLQSIPIMVTAEDSTTTQTYTLNVFRLEPDPGSNAFLSSLGLSDGSLTPAFHPDTLSYTAQVAGDIDQVTVTATPQDGSASIMINNTLVPSGIPSSPIFLVQGQNDPISILAFSENGTTQKFYQITVFRGDLPEPSTNAFLAGLTLSGPVLNEPFFSMLFDYTTQVANGTTSLRVTPVTDNPSASVRVNGTEVVSGQSSLPISLAVGENRVEVLVTAQDPGVSHIYEVLVIREEPGPSPNAALSDLSLSGTRLNPAFAPGTFTYTADVLTYVDQITVSPTAQNPSAAIQVNGSPVVPGQPSAPITLAMGDNLITVMVTAEDGTTQQPYHINVSRHGAPSGVAATVYVVDAPASSPTEFITLAKALEHLTNTLNPNQLGEIRIQTTQPMAVTDLAFTCNVIITLDKGATHTIVGPGNTPLTIDAGGSLDISGLNFENPAGFVINSSVGFSATGSQFNADTAITLGSGAGTLSTRSPLGVRRAAGFVSKSLSFNNGIINGGLSVVAFGATQKNLDINNMTAASLRVTGTFTENSFLSLNANLIPELTLNLGLQNQSQLDVIGHTNLKTATATVQMEGNAAIHFTSNTLAALVAEYKGLKGLVGFQNTFVGNAAMTVNTQEMEFNADKSNFNDFKMEVSHASPAGRFGVNLNGFFAEKSFYLSAPDLPLEASLTAGFTDFKSHGPTTIFLAGNATLTLDTVRFGAEATFKYNLGSGKMETKNRVEFLGKVFVQSMDQAFEFNGSYNHTQFHDDATWDFASANFILRFGSGSEVEEGHSILITGGSHGTGGLKSSSRSALAVTEGEIHMSGINIKGSSGKPGILIKGVDVPVTIEQSRIKSNNNWAIVCMDVDGKLLISDNAEIKGGIFLDGDPDQTGQMIDNQYTVKANTISHNNPGMSCVHSHAIRNLLIEDNEMTATGSGTHGVLVSGGKVTIRGGSIITSGPPASQAIGTGESAGGHNSIVYAEQVSMITGSVQTGPKGYIKLTDNTFANAKIVDYKEGQVPMPRLLNNPVENNSGLDPDEDIIGSLIDWNDDDHNCPDYPTKCDEWDEDEKECGCREDGVDPPGEPGV